MWEALGCSGPADPENERGFFLGTLMRERGDPSGSVKDAESWGLCSTCSTVCVPHGREELGVCTRACVSSEPTVSSTSSLRSRGDPQSLWTGLGGGWSTCRAAGSPLHQGSARVGSLNSWSKLHSIENNTPRQVLSLIKLAIPI